MYSPDQIENFMVYSFNKVVKLLKLLFKAFVKFKVLLHKHRINFRTSLKDKTEQNLFFWFYSMRFFIFIHFLFLPQFLLAQKTEDKIWIKLPQMPFKVFQAHVGALAPSQVSYAQYLLRQRRERTDAFQLKDKLLTAQEFYLSGEEKKALKYFQQITKLALLADWREDERRIILYSFLRMAQIEKDQEKRRALLISAGDFSFFEINKLNYSDFDLFPPPLMKELEQIQKQSNVFFVDWKKVFPYHEVILINGQEVNRDRKGKLPQAFYRITALSSSHRPWSQSLNLSHLMTRKIKTKSLSWGPCRNPKIQAGWGNESTFILPFSNCPSAGLEFKKNKQQLRGQNISHSLTVKAENKTSNSFVKFNDLDSIDSVELQSKSIHSFSSDFSKKRSALSRIPPWMIIGAGVVLFSLAVSLNQSQKSDSGEYIY